MPIPEQANKVFSGEIFDVYQWEQELYNGKTKTFEMLDRPNTVDVIAVAGDDIYYGVQEQPNSGEFFSSFGGRIDPGEEPLEAAKRELREEAGLESDDWELWRETELTSKIDWICYTYIARNCKIVGDQQLDGGEKITVHKTTIADFFRMVIEKPFREYELLLPFMRMELGLEDKQAFFELLRK